MSLMKAGQTRRDEKGIQIEKDLNEKLCAKAKECLHYNGNKKIELGRLSFHRNYCMDSSHLCTSEIRCTEFRAESYRVE